MKALVLILLLWGCAGGAAPARGAVSTTAGLLSALAGVHAGQVILLEPGLYSGVIIKGFSGAATIASRDPRHPAVIADLKVQASRGLTFRDLEFSTVSDPIGPNGAEDTNNYQVLSSTDIHFVRLAVHGDPAGTLATAESGFLIRWSHQVSVADSDFSWLHNAIEHLASDHLTFTRNAFHNLWDDAIRGGGSSFVVVDSNRCWSNHPDKSDTDHPDCIQFWTTNETASAHDITITDNTYDRGTGNQTQGIFLRDEKTTLPYLNLVITGNVIRGALWNGIAVMHAQGLTIGHNTVVPRCDMNSWIRVEDSPGAVLTDNAAGHYVFKNNVGLKETRDRVVACRDDSVAPR